MNEEKRLRAALYARVSTQGKGQDCEVQLRELRELCVRRGWEIVSEYMDAGVSGAKESRPQLDAMLAAGRAGRFDVIVCWKLDRIGRSLRHLVNLLAEIEAVGVSLVSHSDNLDLTTPQGRLLFQIVGAMAEFERSLIRERVKSGLRNAVAKGKTLGRPTVAVDRDRVRELRANGVSWKKISAELKISVGKAYNSR